MADYIQFDIPFEKFIHARRLIAFFPKEGYAIFEGYSRLKKEDLPYKIKIFRYQPEFTANAEFDVEIVGIFKKDLQPPPSKRSSHCCDPDECGCSVSFFPCDIIILRFQLIKDYNTTAKLNWNYCLDYRFTNKLELVFRYLSLVELPDSMYDEYQSLEEDAEFYDGYHKIMNAENDIYKGQFTQ